MGDLERPGKRYGNRTFYHQTMRAFGILPMVPFEILPMVPLVANGTIGNQRTLNVSRQPMVPMLPLVKRWYQ